MVQIVLGGVKLPEVSKDKYSCWEDDLSVQLEMISGRKVIETRGKIWRVRYSYDYMGTDLLREVLAVLRSGAPIVCSVLPDNSDTTVVTNFLVEEIGPPTMAFSRKDNAFWHNISFALREEKPHG